MTDDYVEIISRVCRTCFAGSLPATDDELFIDLVMVALGGTVLDGESQAVLNAFRRGLCEALTDLRHAASVSSHIVN